MILVKLSNESENKYQYTLEECNKQKKKDP